MRLTCTVLLAGGVILCACSRRSGTEATTELLEIGSAPEYAVYCHADVEDGELYASAHYEMFVYAATKQIDPAVNAELSLEDPGQGIQAGETSTGATFVVVVTTDYDTDEAAIVTFVDNDNDGLPDQSTRSTVASMSNVHLVGAALHRGTGTLYAVDMLNQRVLRWEDSTGDKVPDSTSTTFAVVGGVLGAGSDLVSVLGAEEHAVHVKRAEAEVFHASLSVPTYKITDTNEDGSGDVVVKILPSVESILGPSVSVSGVPVDGESELTVRGSDGIDYNVVSGTSTLASFEGSGGPAAVSLSRSLIAGEELEIVEDGQSTASLSVVVADDAYSIISYVGFGRLVQGESMTVHGKAITGSESVEMALEDTSLVWRSATITDYSSEYLTFSVPTTLGIGSGEVESVLLRVSRGSGVPPFLRIVLVSN